MHAHFNGLEDKDEIDTIISKMAKKTVTTRGQHLAAGCPPGTSMADYEKSVRNSTRPGRVMTISTPAKENGSINNDLADFLESGSASKRARTTVSTADGDKDRR